MGRLRGRAGRLRGVTTVGCRALEVPDPVQGVRIPTWVLYPAEAPERVESFGPYALAVAMSAAVVGEALPLVVISHGNNGSPWTYRGIAAHLARAGFVVALIEHPGNSRSDGRLAGTAANLENRPRHVARAIDACSADGELGPRLSRARGVAVIGHSIGGYTALAIAGGRPLTLAHEAPDGVVRAIPVVRHPAVRALVLLAPATVWLMGEGALAEVDVPIMMRTGERDTLAPPIHAELVLGGVPHRERVDHRVVKGAGHFSFQTPFPPAMRQPDFAPSQDPPGFVREAYEAVLCEEIRGFLGRAMAPPAAGGSPDSSPGTSVPGD